MAVYILIHGSWHGAWCWEKVIPLLERAGHQVYAPDLPGHGNDKTPLKNITLKSYLDCVTAILEACQEKVILVGHSMAGIIISQLAEYLPEKIKQLIYIAAFLPRNGESMFDVAKLQAPSRFVKKMEVIPRKNAFGFPVEMIKDFAYHLCDNHLVESIKARLCIDPLLPCNTALKLSEENFGRIPRMYVKCLQDKAILIETQQKMLALMPCQEITLDSDHSPFYSDPEGLVEILEKTAPV